MPWSGSSWGSSWDSGWSTPSWSVPVYTPPPIDYSYLYTPPAYVAPAFDYSVFTPPVFTPYQSTYFPTPSWETWGQPSAVDKYLSAGSALTMGDPYGLASGNSQPWLDYQAANLAVIPGVYSPSWAGGVANAGDVGVGFDYTMGLGASPVDYYGTGFDYTMGLSPSYVSPADYAGMNLNLGAPVFGSPIDFYGAGFDYTMGLGAPDYGTGFDYGTSFDLPSSSAALSGISDFGSGFDYTMGLAPENTATAYNLEQPTPSGIASLPEFPQFAAISPMGSTMTDVDTSPIGAALSSMGGRGTSLNVEGGATSAAASTPITLNPGGGATVTLGSGDQLNLSDTDTQRLLRGETTVAALAAERADSNMQRISPTTVASTQGLSVDDAPYGLGPTGRPVAADPLQAMIDRHLADSGAFTPSDARSNTFERVAPFERTAAESNPFLGKMPAFDPTKMEGTEARYNTRQAEEMARAAAAGPDTFEAQQRRIAEYDPFNIGSGVTPDAMRSFNETMKGIADRGGYTSQWQTVGSDRVMVNDDGTGIGINTETGENYALNRAEVRDMIQRGVLNTAASGYVAATGGSGNRPGGSPPTAPRRSSSASGRGGGGGGGRGGGGGQPPQQQQPARSSAALAGLLAAMAAMAGRDGDDEGRTAAQMELMRQRREQEGNRRAGSSAQQYFTGPGLQRKAEGGIASLDGYAAGGGIGTLGGYSDGGRLLKGPGDGVSDSIPATIGRKRQPARLADGEFVIPARIVSELGNGSTEAGARKLYEMMERIQRDRRKSVGKGKVAVNARTDKHLPA